MTRVIWSLFIIETIMTTTTYIFIAIFGLILGSFVNAFVWRYNSNDTAKKRQKHLSIISGRSMCVHCKHALAWYDLIPVISWLQLHGKCRYCHKPISKQYPLVELVTAMLFLLSYQAYLARLGLIYSAFGLVAWLVLVVGFVVLLVYDQKFQILPTQIIYSLYAPAMLFCLSAVLPAQFSLQRILLIGLSSCLYGGLFWAIYWVSKGTWIGGGDVRLGFLLGLILQTPLNSFVSLFFASLIGTILILPSVVTKKTSMNTKIPFGPLLLIGTFIVVLYGQTIIDSYLRVVLY